MDAQGSALISSYYGSPGLNNQNCELYICWDHYTQMIWKDTSQVCSLIMYCSYVFLNIFLTLFFKYLPSLDVQHVSIINNGTTFSACTTHKETSKVGQSIENEKDI